MSGVRLPTACLKGTIHYTEGFLNELALLIDNAYDFLVELTIDTVCFHLADCFLKTTDRQKPGLTMKLVFNSYTLYKDPGSGSAIKTMLAEEITKAINNHEKINGRFRDRVIVHLNFAEEFSFSSYF